MTKLDKYAEIFCNIFEVEPEELNEDFTFKNIGAWSSLTHLTLIAELEDTFEVIFDPDDIMHYGSYENGKLILERYGVDLSSEVV